MSFNFLISKFLLFFSSLFPPFLRVTQYFCCFNFSLQRYNKFLKAQKNLTQTLNSLTQNLQVKTFILRKFHFGIFVKFFAKN